MSSSRIHDMPVLAARADELAAPLYNLWKRARIRHQLPLRMELTGVRQMAVIIDDEAWVVVDQNQYDLPILAWVDFEDTGRDALHTPVACTLNFYHFMASSLRLRVLDSIERELQARLK